MKLDIIGADMVTAHGSGRAKVFAAFLEGGVAVHPLRHLDKSQYRCQHAYEIADVAQSAAGRSTDWLVTVVLRALDEAHVDFCEQRVVVLVGTGLREQATLERWQASNADFSLEHWDYRVALQSALGAPVPVFTFVNACSASLCCMSLASDMLELEQADIVVVAGTDSVTTSMYGLLDRANGDPPKTIQPFDRARKGVLMGEGAAAVVLRRSDRSTCAGSHVLGTLTATVQNCDGSHETAPDSRGMLRLFELAHREAGICTSDVDLVIAHGTGTTLNDDTEARALAEFYGNDAGQVMLSAVKAMTGHTAGASGLVSIITGIHILHEGTIPPSPGLLDPIDDAGRFDVVTSRRMDCDVKRIQINAFGFGGVNAITIMERVSGND